MKSATLIYSIFIFYLLGKYSKIPLNLMVIIWFFGFGGCMFLWAGLYLNNLQLVYGGFFIISTLGFILIHQILIKHHFNKKKINAKIDTK
tara:strand:- start:121 stop:390 length:270 start_codon:yes stop_codon:yes gene_type:complete